MTLVETDPRSPRARALLEQSHALMNSLFPKGACHYLDLDALAQPHITLWLTEDAHACGALARMNGYGEIKSLFTAPAARGKGHADRLLTNIIDTATTEGLPLLRLETGTGLDAAHRLYTRHGFTPCDPFGPYTDSPYSIFMEKPLITP
ncbi:GNAT family N-acetyltransferase [Aestuariibius sp. 2305UL40-4]|uniref:GNAT family N-acetyltransferase n=1 Tax=Aestuariibius violaceus TaxID=3234132 RepID=UPI00345E9CA1